MKEGVDQTTIPDHDECVALLRDCGCEDHVIAHCDAVRQLAAKMASVCGAQMQLVEAGAMLHDIGRCRTHSIRHAVEGADVARAFGLPKELVNIIERHIGGGISEEESEALGLPRKSYLPVTLEEKIVAHADNLIEGTKRVSVQEAVDALAEHGLASVAERVMALHEEISRIARVDLDKLD
ncbi:MAG: HDIG domain-containing protein [Methanobacteriota archaeon]|nr:MAG: HDIG domain-containing protein [Euryarchaeota archaeon]